MSEHLHAEHVAGCFRCELSREEERQYEQYTPTTVQVLDAAVQTGFYSYAEVNRWHQAALRRAKAEAWREGHDAGWTAHYNGDDFSVYRNPYRADQIEEGHQ